VCELSPYVPGEQPRIANPVKLNTNESPFGPSPLALDVMRAAAADSLRLFPDPAATELREGLVAGGVIEALIVWYRRNPRRSYATTNNRERHHHAYGVVGPPEASLDLFAEVKAGYGFHGLSRHLSQTLITRQDSLNRE